MEPKTNNFFKKKSGKSVGKRVGKTAGRELIIDFGSIKLVGVLRFSRETGSRE